MNNSEWVVIGNYGGYFDFNNEFVVCEEYGLTDADTDRYAIDIMNDEGYYDESGKFMRWNEYD